ncbi:disulfide bond formation protein DsbB [Phenylobacterium zucineum HLK1]|uniref:Disulfide bond formation protein DsbB n=1 Tax=Phenylobacterium zucineum (strain HLK1) TaxID=450851 RepID=B4R8C6_PHEZH|nr:disulfide bond formation protein B [Phenylobacterium zucineum]ACG79244.1 disulfide bond formation protein DsbB [Phenylobacterium zucineum HLK1]
MTLLAPLLDRWRLCAVLASAAMLAIAHAFQTFGGYAPCTLCLRQREVYWVAIALGVIFMAIVRLPGGPRWREATCWVLGLVFAVGVGIAVYHAGAEWKFWPGPTACASAGAGVDAAALSDFLAGARVRPPACDEAPWVFAGLSMAGWNALISLGLVALSVMAALRERSKR